MKALLEVKAATLRGETKHIEHDNITVAEWLETWLEINKNKWKKTTLIQRELAVKNHMKPLLGHYKLKKLDRATYQTKYINELEKKFKPGTVKLLHSLFKIATNAAIEEEILARNRFIKIVIKDEDTIASKAKTNFLTPIELNKVLKTLKETDNITNYSFILTIAYTGMRRGEACGLQWNNIDFENNTITIERTRDDRGTRTPKTKNSYRTILVDNMIIEQLKRYRTWCKKTMLKYNIKYHDARFVFISENSEPITEMKCQYPFKQAQLKAGIINDDGLAKCSLHSLRHTHATILLNKGQNVKVIAERLGNTPTMVMNTYGHVMKELEQQSVAIFSDTLQL